VGKEGARSLNDHATTITANMIGSLTMNCRVAQLMASNKLATASERGYGPESAAPTPKK
jgi:hypothetical protein